MSESTYLNIFRSLNVRLKPSDISSNWKFKSTRNMSISDLYVENVRNYERITSQSSNKYRKAELEQMAMMRRRPIEQTKFNHSHIRFDITEPKVYFQNRTTIGLLRDMCRFVQGEQLWDRKQGGSHICIYLARPTSGYVHLSGDKFYELHPNAAVFYSNFKKIKNYYVST